MKFLLIISFFFVVLSCKEVVLNKKFVFTDAKYLLSIEGQISNDTNNNYVKISRSTMFTTDSIINITYAKTTIFINNLDNSISFEHLENGQYVPKNTGFNTNQRDKYKLQVILNNDTINSPWIRSPKAVKINNLYANPIIKKPPIIPSQKDEIIYYPKIIVKDSVGVRNYYQWIFWRNKILYDNLLSFEIQEDHFFDGQGIPNNFVKYQYILGDTITVELISINKANFDYLRAINAQINTLNLPSQTTPENIFGNLFGNKPKKILGYFRVCHISKKKYVIN